MTNSSFLPRQLVVFAVVLPLAAIIGYLLATPDQFRSMSLVGLALGVLSIPILLKYHYPLLIFSWNAALSVFFLPGQPALWMVVALISLSVSLLTYTLNRQAGFLNVPSITWPLLFLTFVILVTAKLTGGIGLRSLGSGTYGGKKFFFLLMAIVGYFAISCHRIPLEKGNRYAGLYVLPGLTSAVSNLAYNAGPAFWWLFYFFPVENVASQVMEDFGNEAAPVKFSRLAGFGAAGITAFSYMLMRYGVRGVLDLTKPWRLLLLFCVISFSLFAGFRSVLIIYFLVFAAQFCVEKLYRTWLLPALLGASLAGLGLLIPLAPRLPISVQRSLSFLPIEINAYARANAQSSTEWRMEMWQILLPQVPRYFWLGKGYAIDPADLHLTTEAVKKGLIKDYEWALVSGDYHSGPLSVFIPLGIWGTIGFVWFLLAGWRLLYQNYRYGDPALRNVNCFLLSYFLARASFYFIGFGGFTTDLSLFVGMVGLSVAINGGKRSEASLQLPSAEPIPALAPAAG
jgi:hypothetical protein